MFEHLGTRTKLVVFLVIAFVFGLGMGRGLDWTRRGAASVANSGARLPAVIQAVTPEARPDVPAANELGATFTAVSDAVTPAVVRIQTERRSGRVPARFRDLFRESPDQEAPPIPQLAGGTGFLISPNGYIVTNQHVIDGAERIGVTLSDKRRFEATLIGRDRTTDVAVIKIDAEELPTMVLGDSDAARVGEWVLAVGNPGFGGESTLDFTVTSGIISAKGRPLGIIGPELVAEEDPAAGYAIEDFIQTDAVINPGNSGGPLVNLNGEVVGVNTAIATGTGYYQGYGFAIPINLARRVMTDLIEYGRVRRALLGISIQEVGEEDAEEYGLPEISGVLVEDFQPDSPARAAGLRRHDVIVAIGGRRVGRTGELQGVIAQYSPRDRVEVEVIRYGEPLRFEVQLTEAPFAEEAMATPAGPEPDPSPHGLGIELGELTGSLARELGYDRAGGAVVTNVDVRSPAAGKVGRGQRIVAIDRVPIEAASEGERLLQGARSGDVLSFLLENGQGQTRIVNLRVP